MVRVGPPTCTIQRQCAVERVGGGNYARVVAGAMSRLGVGAGGGAELGSGAEHKEDGPEQEGGAHGQMELKAIRAFVEVGLHNVDARLDQQASGHATRSLDAGYAAGSRLAKPRWRRRGPSAGCAGGHRRGARWADRGRRGAR